MRISAIRSIGKFLTGVTFAEVTRPIIIIAAILTGIASRRCAGQGTLTFTFDGHPAGYGTPTSGYNESGMHFSNPFGLENLIWEGAGVSGMPENGTAYLQSSTGANLGFSLLSGAYFDFVSFDAAEYPTSPNPLTLQVVGYHVMGARVTNYFTLDGINDGTGPLQDFQTFHPDSQFLHVYRVDVLTGSWSLDNLVISGVPEPSTCALALIGIGSILVSRFRTWDK